MAVLWSGNVESQQLVHQESGVTGWAYNWEVNGGFEETPYFEQMTGPGLVFIEGGTFTMGQVDDDLEFNWDNQAKSNNCFFITWTKLR